MDDTTEFTSSPDPTDSKLQEAATETNTWTNNNDMKLNLTKTKEMIIDFHKEKADPPPIKLDNITIDRVTSIKLLGVYISSDLTWNLHISHIISKGAQRLYLLSQLRRSGISDHDLVQVYQTLVRPILEYACPVWHTCLPKYQHEDIERIQRRALHIIFPNLSYSSALQLVNLPTLQTRRDNICAKFFHKIECPSDPLHDLLPPRRSIKYGLRNNIKYYLPKIRTCRFMNSFINRYASMNI